MQIKGQILVTGEYQQTVRVYDWWGRENREYRAEFNRKSGVWEHTWQVINTRLWVVQVYRESLLIDPELTYILLGQGAARSYTEGMLHGWVSAYVNVDKDVIIKYRYREGVSDFVVGLRDLGSDISGL